MGKSTYDPGNPDHQLPWEYEMMARCGGLTIEQARNIWRLAFITGAGEALKDTNEMLERVKGTLDAKRAAAD